MALTRMLLLTANEAATVRGTTQLGHGLDPREIEAGPLAGRAVLPLAVLSDPAHSAQRLFLLQVEQANIDPEVCWPPAPEA